MTLENRLKGALSSLRRHAGLTVAGIGLLAATGVGTGSPTAPAGVYGTTYDIHGAPLDSVVVVIDGMATMSDSLGNYFLPEALTGVEDPIEQHYITKRVGGGGCEGPHTVTVPVDEFGNEIHKQNIVLPKAQKEFLPSYIYFSKDGHFSYAEDFSGKTGVVAFNIVLPPTLYMDIPTHPEGIPINPTDWKDYHDLNGAPVPPEGVANSQLWQPSRIEAKINVDIRPEWTTAEYNYIRQQLSQWAESEIDIDGIYGMPTIFNFVTRGSLYPTSIGWRIKRDDHFGVVPLRELVNGEYFVKHAEISLQYADPAFLWDMVHEFNHGFDGMIAHAGLPLNPEYNVNGYSLMNEDAVPAVPPDKPYQKLAHQLAKMRVTDNSPNFVQKQMGSDANYIQ